MCGIVGRAGLLKLEDEKIFKTLLLLDYFRGQDSTGVAVVSKKGTTDVLKIADDPIMLFQQQDYNNTVVGHSDAIWIGHNRAATIGGTSRANAHPFEAGHIIGVHNGTLDKECFSHLKARLSGDYGTDSETLYQHMSIYGVEDTISRLQGAWALVWYDSKDETLNMVRNDKRPLFLCKIDRGTSKVLTWASEYQMIVAARAMANVPDGKLITDDEGYGFFPLEINKLHTWTKTQLLAGDLEPTVVPMEGKAEAPKSTNVTYPSNNNSSSTMTTMGVAPNTFTTVKDTYEVNDLELEEEEGMVLGCIPQDEWDEMTKFGCSCCGADIDAEEQGLVVYINEGVVICGNCSEETETIVTNASGLRLTDRIIG